MAGSSSGVAIIPLEYSIALDAASVWLASYSPRKILCEQPALEQEVSQHLPIVKTPPWRSALWVEPQRLTWEKTLVDLSTQLPNDSNLAVLLSLPPARRLPDRHTWPTTSLGERPGGLNTLTHALLRHGFVINSVHGFHTGQSVFLNLAASFSRKLSCLALADRIEFFARQHYIKLTSKAWFATCALILAIQQ
jgi:hypothetical protein